jgi:hypothetical protein
MLVKSYNPLLWILSRKGHKFMTNNTEKYRMFEIEWITSPSIPWQQGPGVEFRYKREQGILIGFIEGYGWHHENSGFCKTYTLTEDSKAWGEFQPDAPEILNKLKECIYQVLREHRFFGLIKDNIFAWPIAEPKKK